MTPFASVAPSTAQYLASRTDDQLRQAAFGLSADDTSYLNRLSASQLSADQQYIMSRSREQLIRQVLAVPADAPLSSDLTVLLGFAPANIPQAAAAAPDDVTPALVSKAGVRVGTHQLSWGVVALGAAVLAALYVFVLGD